MCPSIRKDFTPDHNFSVFHSKDCVTECDLLYNINSSIALDIIKFSSASKVVFIPKEGNLNN